MNKTKENIVKAQAIDWVYEQVKELNTAWCIDYNKRRVNELCLKVDELSAIEGVEQEDVEYYENEIERLSLETDKKLEIISKVLEFIETL